MHSPRHGLVCANVIKLILKGLPDEIRGLLFSNQPPILIRELDQGHHLQIICRPDIAYIAKERLIPIRRGEQHLSVSPDLAVEVFEPGDKWEAVDQMVNDCLGVGVREFWVLRTRERDLRIYGAARGPLTMTTASNVTSAVLPGFRCTVGDFFAGL